MSSNSVALGLDVDGPPSEWMPYKIVGAVVCMNQEGQTETWHFESEAIQNWEAIGLLEENLAIRRDAAVPLYFASWEDDEDDD